MRISTESKPLPLRQISIQDNFWSEYIRLVREVVVPYQWEALNDRIEGVEPSHAIRNFKIAAGLEKGSFYGMVFQDSDVAKWLEAVSYLLEAEANPELGRLADEVIEIIAKAQQADGYLNTYFTLKEPGGRWTNLAECHELYCAGHMIEAAVAYYSATGKSKLLEVACRLADCIDGAFGPEEGKIRGYDGHPEIELALIKLARTTNNETYAELSRFFVDERGKEPGFYELEFHRRGGTVHFPSLDMVHDRAYSQAHMPVRRQETAEGHAVRAVYLIAGMADVAAETGDLELLEACRRLWRNIVSKRMYVTGAIGSMAQGESFSLDYDLPGDTAYAETCASIGLIFLAHRMLQIEAKSEYADVMERALFNTVISGMSQDGRHFFYVNPLEVWPEACGKNKNLDHVKPQRQGWFGCACCPPNIARLLASLGQYVYTASENTVYAHLFIGSEAEFCMADGHKVKLIQHSQLPWEGKVQFELVLENAVPFTLAVRVPDWCPEARLRINGDDWPSDPTVDGYVRIVRNWQPQDVVELDLAMPVLRIKGHPLLRETAGKVALQRGPVVYCLEEADNGPNLHQFALPASSEPSAHFDRGLLRGLQIIQAAAERAVAEEWDQQLYKANEAVRTEPVTATFIPYFAWANRGLGEMTVWVRESYGNPLEG
ncbi:glycoside hydrolase family 127 protein [Paenibacillus hamazuiensis]|uniref:glycoside hydrolase family 127 protein n=1 Tax=Paenibacillus hamazuiensis TaxID=2936508 RepID=UPI00200D2139|nr:beta-L-arabinofuranosidase domain-containing protein [Paenibacillus hamazuiensis]